MKKVFKALAVLAIQALVGGVCTSAVAQLAQKPTVYAQRVAAPRNTVEQTVDARPFLTRIDSRADFDAMARVYDAGTPLELLHLLFLVDRAQGNAVHFINTRRYPLHENFVRAQKHAVQLAAQAWKDNYLSPQRRYILGTLSWQRATQQWAFELWEGDRITAPLLQLAQQQLQAQFFAPLVFKPNATQQEAVAAAAAVPVLTQAAAIAAQGYMPLNTGRAVGRVRVLDDAQQVDDLAPDDIAVLTQVPLNLPPVAGVITASPSTTLSHVNLLAKGWGIPNAYVQGADTSLRALDGQWVELTVERTGHAVRVLTGQALEDALRTPNTRKHATTVWPQPVLTEQRLRPLASLRVADRAHCGAKAATLGALAHAKRTQYQRAWADVAPVPDGFCIPFAEFAAFMAQPAAQALLQQAYDTPGFLTDRAVRTKALTTLREGLVALPVAPAQAQRWQHQWQRQLGGAGVFVRSSSNSEDLPHFSGAGLYSTVPNVKEADKLTQAVKTVWTSVYNMEAFEARRWFGVPHDRVVMGVLVQRAVDSQASGVLITANPLDPLQQGVTYVVAKRGLGIRVVEGRRQAEEVLYTRRSGAIAVLSRSQDAVALLLDAQGGVREEAVEPGRAVLSDDMVRRLARVGEQVRHLLGGRAQDIEWAVDPAGKLVLLQSRPYITPQ